MPNITKTTERLNFFEIAKFFPKQIEALKEVFKNRFVLYGGSAGSGKSYWLRWTALYFALYYAQKYQTKPFLGIFCRTYRELEDRHLKYVRTEFPEWIGTFYEQKHEFVLKDEYGGGIISFRNLEEPSNYQSAQFALIGVDEITEIPYETFLILYVRNRFPGIPETKFICASNPVGEHMLWVRRFFVEKNLPAEFEQFRDQIAYVKALPLDNPHLPTEYYKQLESLPESERKAFLEGDWYAFEEQIDIRGFIPLISSKDLDNSIISPEQGINFFKGNDNVLGVDVGAGGDKTAIVVRNRLGAKILFNEKLSDTMQCISQLVNFISVYRPLAVCVDIIGVGKGVYDRLLEVGFSNVFGINFGGKADSNEFENKKAQLYWNLRDWLLKGGKLVENSAWNELLTIKYKITSDRKISIISKDILRKEGIASPNVADALALTFAVDIQSLLDFQYAFDFSEFEI